MQECEGSQLFPLVAEHANSQILHPRHLSGSQTMYFRGICTTKVCAHIIASVYFSGINSRFRHLKSPRVQKWAEIADKGYGEKGFKKDCLSLVMLSG